MPRLTTLKPRIGTVSGRLQLAAAQQTERIRGSALQAIRRRILYRDAGICRCDDCQRAANLKPATEVEHYLPLWAGGQEDDSNRYAINPACHEAKTACEAAMRSRSGFDLSACTCGRHGDQRLTKDAAVKAAETA